MSAAQQIGTPSFEKLLDGLSEVDRARIRWQLRRAAAARASVHDFFEYVVREETTQVPVSELPHQKLFFDFRDRHRQCVIRMPVGFSKTFNTATYLLHAAGHDPLLTSAVISSTAEQAQKPLAMIRFYIEESPELRLVFPKLTPSTRDGEPWTQSKLTVARDGILRDPTFVAIGQDSGRLPGSRLKIIAVDDILSRENSQTKAQRQAVIDWFGGEVLSRRLKVQGEEARICVTNTPRDPEDLTYFLEKQRGWPTMTMDAFGDITFSNTDFDVPYIRPTYRIQEAGESDPCRLVANDTAELVAQATAENDPSVEPVLPDDPSVDEFDLVPLWPGRWPLAALLKDRDEAPNLSEWNQTMRCRAASEDTAKIKREWIERAKQLARDLGYATMPASWSRGNTFTGIDLAFGKNKQHDFTCFFTIFVDEMGRRVILDVETGRWSGTGVLERMAAKHRQFGSILCVETNGAQVWAKEFGLEFDASLPIRSHHTDGKKWDVNFGIEMLFTDIENGLWVIPSGSRHVETWIENMRLFDPDKHTPDDVMASWIATSTARKCGAFAVSRMRRRGQEPGKIANVLAR